MLARFLIFFWGSKKQKRNAPAVVYVFFVIGELVIPIGLLQVTTHELAGVTSPPQACLFFTFLSSSLLCSTSTKCLSYKNSSVFSLFLANLRFFRIPYKSHPLIGSRILLLTALIFSDWIWHRNIKGRQGEKFPPDALLVINAIAYTLVFNSEIIQPLLELILSA